MMKISERQKVLVTLLVAIFAVVVSDAESHAASQFPASEMRQISTLLNEGEAPFSADQIDQFEPADAKERKIK